MSKKQQVKNYSEYLDFISGSYPTYDFNDKKRVVSDHINYMLDRTGKMFKYDNLPETTTKRIVERFLQIFGYVIVTKVEGELYVFPGKLGGGLGGVLDHNYEPTQFIASNPYLKYFKTLNIGEDCVIIRNDSNQRGLLPMFSRYATLLCENELSMKITSVNERAIAMISASDDGTRAGATKFLDDLEAGVLGVAAENIFLEGIRVQPLSNNGESLTSLIEFEQYLKASWYNEIGLNANYNMKRESINSNEAQLNDDALMPLIEDMLECRRVGWEQVEKLFGHKVTVELETIWETKELEEEAYKEALENGELAIEGTTEETEVKPEEDNKEVEENEETESD